MEVVAYQLLCKHANEQKESRLAVPLLLILVQPDQPVNKGFLFLFSFSFFNCCFWP